MIITGIHTPAIQRARMLAQGIAPLTLGKWVSERSLSYRQCRAWLLDYAKLDTEADFFCSSVPYALRRLATMQRRKSLRSWNRWCRRQLTRLPLRFSHYGTSSNHGTPSWATRVFGHREVYRALGGWLRRTCPKTRQSSFALARRRQAVPVGGS